LKEKNPDVEKLEEAFNSQKDNSFFILSCYNITMPKLNVLVAGSTGYIGVQLIKLLVKHNDIKIRFLCGNSSVGKIFLNMKNHWVKKVTKDIDIKISLKKQICLTAYYVSSDIL